jgi:hypothetical protein
LESEQDGCAKDDLLSMQDMAAYKAPKVYQVMGLPCVAAHSHADYTHLPSDEYNVPAVILWHEAI